MDLLPPCQGSYVLVLSVSKTSVCLSAGLHTFFFFLKHGGRMGHEAKEELLVPMGLGKGTCGSTGQLVLIWQGFLASFRERRPS